MSRITQTERNKYHISNLADRPNAMQTFGRGGLSASEMKKKFDDQFDFLADKHNELQERYENDEIPRSKAEEGRIAAEIGRAAAEAERNRLENQRISNEKQRVEAENSRVIAENQRNKTLNEAIDKIDVTVKDALQKAKDGGEFSYILTEDDKEEIAEKVEEMAIGDIDRALDNIIAIQNEMLSGAWITLVFDTANYNKATKAITSNFAWSNTTKLSKVTLLYYTTTCYSTNAIDIAYFAKCYNYDQLADLVGADTIACIVTDAKAGRVGKINTLYSSGAIESSRSAYVNEGAIKGAWNSRENGDIPAVKVINGVAYQTFTMIEGQADGNFHLQAEVQAQETYDAAQDTPRYLVAKVRTRGDAKGIILKFDGTAGRADFEYRGTDLTGGNV